MEVACAVEGGYLAHGATMLHSLLTQTAGDGVRVHYLHGADLDADSKAKLGEMVGGLGGEIEFVEVNADPFKGIPTEGFTGLATWYRVLLPELLGEVDRVLVLDADVVVMASPESLWEIDLDGAYLAAVTNVLPQQFMERPAQIGISPHDYFNAGVMLLDLERMRADRCVERILAYARAHASELALRDQDALNAILSERRHALHPRWNCMNALTTIPWSAYVFDQAQINEARANPIIRHYEGPQPYKPWKPDFQLDDGDAYRRHRQKTPWPQQRPSVREGGVRPRVRSALKDVKDRVAGGRGSR